MDTIQSPGSSQGEPSQHTPSSIAKEAAGKVVEIAGQALQQARSSGNSLAAAAGGTMKESLGQKIADGGEWIAGVADAAKCAADRLETNSPELAGMVRRAASSIEGFSGELRNRSVDELAQTASDFARRRPEIVFGVSALVGFLAFRVLTSSAAIGLVGPKA